MKVKLIERGSSDQGGIADLETKHLPSVGDEISLDFGAGHSSHYVVTKRIFRAYAEKGDIGTAFIEVERRQDSPHSWMDNL
ncbi:hypothetical protein P1J78_04130 [Psychromarinibacter sp. C21-152]|uniref:Uncharacterized protein n=1 Tax=Psychromarinibacter sediminicola TaxID=3033385 RepID=A0AAE3NL42_9RHOB|nr:hypothetical protein [Psychromarinibacter sediminicola]MDF0599913.1 hypothetical protein [Psychromarinibacter sediminicola]